MRGGLEAIDGKLEFTESSPATGAYYLYCGARRCVAVRAVPIMYHPQSRKVINLFVRVKTGQYDHYQITIAKNCVMLL